MRAASYIAQGAKDVRLEASLVHRGEEIDGLTGRPFECELSVFDAAVGKTGGCFAAVHEFAADERAVFVDMPVKFDALILEGFVDVHDPPRALLFRLVAYGNRARLVGGARSAHHRSAHAIVGPWSGPALEWTRRL